MKVAHRVNRKDVKEHRHHEEVRNEAHYVLACISQEINRPKDNRDQVNGQHNYSGQRKPGEVSDTVRFISVGGFVEDELIHNETSLGHEINYASDYDCSQQREDHCYKPKVSYALLHRQS